MPRRTNARSMSYEQEPRGQATAGDWRDKILRNQLLIRGAEAWQTEGINSVPNNSTNSTGVLPVDLI
jgi:hypothetical protein